MERKLTQRGYSEQVIEAALDRLRGAGLQSDERFAEAFLANRIERGKGPVLIRAHLRERGVDEAVVERAFEGADVDWAAQALAVHARRFGEGIPADFEDKARRMRFLNARGFTGEQIRAAMRSLGAD